MSPDPNVTDAEQTVRAAFEAHRGGRRGALEQSDVDVIAETAFAIAGVKPTVELIRQIAGGGSPNTIHPKLDAWFRRGREPAATSELPAELHAVWERLQVAAAATVRAELAPTIAAVDADRAALGAGQAQLAVDQAALATERATIERLVATLRDDFQALQARNDALQVDVARLATAGREADIALGQRQEEIVRLETERVSTVTEHARLVGLLATAEANRQTQEDALTAVREATASAETQISGLQRVAAESAHALAAARQAAEITGRDLAAAHAEVAALTGRVTQLEQALQLAQTRASADATLREHLTAELHREREALASIRTTAAEAGEAVAAGHATINALRGETERLHALVRPATAGSRRPSKR